MVPYLFNPPRSPWKWIYPINTHYIRCIWDWLLGVPSQRYQHFPDDSWRLGWEMIVMSKVQVLNSSTATTPSQIGQAKLKDRETQVEAKTWGEVAFLDRKQTFLAILLVPFLEWLSDPFKWLSDLQLGDQKVTLKHLFFFFRDQMGL